MKEHDYHLFCPCFDCEFHRTLMRCRKRREAVK